MTTFTREQIHDARRQADAAFESICGSLGRDNDGVDRGVDAWIDVLGAVLALGQVRNRRQVNLARQVANQEEWTAGRHLPSGAAAEAWVTKFAWALELDVPEAADPAPQPETPVAVTDEAVAAAAWALCVHEHGEDEAEVIWEDEDQSGDYLDAARTMLEAAAPHLGVGR